VVAEPRLTHEYRDLSTAPRVLVALAKYSATTARFAIRRDRMNWVIAYNRDRQAARRRTAKTRKQRSFP